MKITRWILAALLLSSAVLASLPSRTFAQSSDPSGEIATGTSGFTGDESTDRWWGVAGAAICGGEMWLLRTQPEIGINPYVLAAGIAGCLLGALDAIGTT